jgi:transposase-like protein
MAERGLAVDHVTIWRWVQHYAPLLNQGLRRELRRPNGSWRVDETGCVANANFLACSTVGNVAGTRVKRAFGQKQSSARLFCTHYLQHIHRDQFDAGGNCRFAGF